MKTNVKASKGNTLTIVMVFISIIGILSIGIISVIGMTMKKELIKANKEVEQLCLENEGYHFLNAYLKNDNNIDLDIYTKVDESNYKYDTLGISVEIKTLDNTNFSICLSKDKYKVYISGEFKEGLTSNYYTITETRKE